MGISLQSTIFFIIMILYIFFTTSYHMNVTFLYKLITVFVITLCIQYLSTTNSQIISWGLVSIPIFYILSIFILQYLLNI